MTAPRAKTDFFDGKAWLRSSHKISCSLTPNEMCDFTDFVTFSNARNDTCFVNQAFPIRLNAGNSSKSGQIFNFLGYFKGELHASEEFLVQNEQFLWEKPG